MQCYFGCFHSLLNYAILAWGHSASANNIFALQRRCIRVIAGIGYRDDCRQCFIQYGVLTLPSMYIKECLKFAHKHKDKWQMVKDVHRYDTRGGQDYVLGYSRLKRSESSHNYWAIKMYNKIPTTMRQQPIKSFNSQVTVILKRQAFYSVQEFFEFNF